MDDNLGIHGGLEDGALRFKLLSELSRVDESTVVGEGYSFTEEADKQRLDISGGRGTCGGITVVSNGQSAREGLESSFIEDFLYQAHTSMDS
jgi:hypothetical protein